MKNISNIIKDSNQNNMPNKKHPVIFEGKKSARLYDRCGIDFHCSGGTFDSENI